MSKKEEKQIQGGVATREKACKARVPAHPPALSDVRAKLHASGPRGGAGHSVRKG